MRVKYQVFDYGTVHAWAVNRGPFQHAVRVRPPSVRRRWIPVRKPRVSVKLHRKAINQLKAWALSTTKPSDRLSIIRRRWVENATALEQHQARSV